MKKTSLLLVLCLVLTVCFSACMKPANNNEPEETTLSFNEKVSYYDSLADAGEVATEEATVAGALYKVTGSQVMVKSEVYAKIIDIFNRNYPSIYYKYGEGYYEPVVTLNFEPAYLRNDPANVVGNTINININWFNDNPDKVNVIIYYIASTVLDHNASSEEWMKNGINYYIGAEFGANGYEYTGRYTGGNYLEDAAECAGFFRWIEVKYNASIAHRLNRLLLSTTWYDKDFWIDETGRSLERLWAEYKAS